MTELSKIKQELQALSNPQKAVVLQKYFKTGKGEYGQGDKFLGITVPEVRKVAKRFYANLSVRELEQLLQSTIHEHRFAALEALVMKFEKANDTEQKQIFNLYLKNTKHINNWDLVDTSAEYIVGAYLQNRAKAALLKLAKSKNLWERRIAIISTFHLIKQNDFDETLRISKILLKDEQDLIHKAVGWMLREVGNRNFKIEAQFLDKYAAVMPRTMLRYAIEKFPEAKRKNYLNKSRVQSQSEKKTTKPALKPPVNRDLDKAIKLVLKVIKLSLPKVKQEMKFGLPFFWPFCYLTVKPNKLILGLCYGVMLTDPLKRLSGTQKSVRHYIVTNPEDAQPEYLAMLLEESWELYQQGIRPFSQNK